MIGDSLAVLSKEDAGRVIRPRWSASAVTQHTYPRTIREGLVTSPPRVTFQTSAPPFGRGPGSGLRERRGASRGHQRSDSFE